MSVRDDVIFLHAMYDMPIKQLMQITHYVGGDLAFPPACRLHATNLYQNYRRKTHPLTPKTHSKGSKIFLITLLENYLLDLLTQNIEAGKMSRKARSPYCNSTTPKKAKAKEYSDIEDDLDDDFNNVTVDDSFYNNDPVVPMDPVVPVV